MSKTLIRRVVGLALMFFILAIPSAMATHLRAGEVTARLIDCVNRTYEITVTVYTNTGSSVLFGGRAGEEDILDFGDGDWMLVPETPNTPRPDLGANIGTASFTVQHTFPANGRYIISYREPNRNEGVLNMDGSVNTRFYLETEVIIDPFLGCNNTPLLGIPPIDQACSGVAFFHNPGAYDPDGDSLSYELRIPFSDRDLEVVNYRSPDDPGFYTNLDYAHANEDGSGPPSFSIDPVTGTLTWDAPGAGGEYNVAFVVIEWKRFQGEWQQIGFVRRDMQIIVNADCKNTRPDLIVPEDICVEAGTTVSETILGIDPENDQVKIEAFSEILDENFGSPATYSPNPAVFAPSNPPYELSFEWNTTCDHIKQQPYQVVFKITDNPPSPRPKLVTFKTWRIRVIGPKPQWTGTGTTVNGRSVTLDWEDYTCTNAERMQVWRRVDSFNFVPAECQTGMPDSLGYELIAQVPIAASGYIDNNGGIGLAPGAAYCYRLVAIFPSPRGGESIVSDEVCTPPIQAFAPIVTNVTIDKTDPADGQITIKWQPPFDAGTVDYTYKLLRGNGLVGFPTQIINPAGTDQLSYVDTGMNTADLAFHYRIICYANGVEVDTSAVASTVRLETSSGLSQIDLSWNAFVPWSNLNPAYPYHIIYRGDAGQTEAELERIDTVYVTQNGFMYTDEGQWNGIPLEEGRTYCYRVETRGGYGNPAIDNPPTGLINFSQIICTEPSDTLPPCKVDPVIAVNAPDCSDPTKLPCARDTYQNEISWERPNKGDCDNDIAKYRIYVANTTNGTFVLYDSTFETSYIDENLPSHARCYKVSAVDRSGNEGELSNEVCIDNCPYYELPNVFTPGGDDTCNDLFSAFSDRAIIGGGEGECGSIPQENRDKCARFVERVQLKVFNRWGQEVYSYASGSERTIFIDWDGRDNNGRELSSGVYFYVADVTFTTIDPNKRNQTIKGWVHLIR